MRRLSTSQKCLSFCVYILRRHQRVQRYAERYAVRNYADYGDNAELSSHR